MASSLSKSGIYQITNLVNGKFYLGSAVDIKKRWVNHRWELNKGIHANSHLQAAWNLYGKENFVCDVIELVEDKFWLLLREQAWLNRTRCFNREIGYNLLEIAGSRQGATTSPETKIKLSKATTAAKLGKPLSDFHKQNLSLSHLGKPWTEAQRRGRKNYHKNKVYSTEERKMRSNQVIGNHNPFYGKTHSPDLLSKLADDAERGRHIRWHVNRSIVDPKCRFCIQ
jgi:group I intron endonuclease